MTKSNDLFNAMLKFGLDEDEAASLTDRAVEIYAKRKQQIVKKAK